MTARVTTLKGPGAGEYYVEALPSYYLESGEPKGVWYGRGAGMLGLDGTVSDDAFLKVMAGLRPVRPDDAHLGRAYTDNSVRGFDVTASAPKSVSTLFAVGDDDTRRHVLEAHDTAVTAVVGWIEDHAHTRHRIAGEVAVVDAEGIIAATFRQHTSRALDPQLHTHVVVANRVKAPDGRWLALDARSLKVDQRTLSALYHAALRSELTQRLGVAWEPVENGIAEIANVPAPVLEEFSTRTAAIQRRIDLKIDRFIDTFERQPTPRERWKLEREAVVDSRPAKTHGHAASDLHDDWVGRLAEHGVSPQRLVTRTTRQVEARALDRTAAENVILDALASISEQRSSWRPAELARKVASHIPTDVHIDGAQIGAVVQVLTERAMAEYCLDISRPVPDGARVRRDGRPITESALDRALTTPAILEQEQRLMAWTERRLATPGLDSAAAVDRSALELTVPQSQTAAAIAGTADLVMVVGPAGTGKTTALAPAVGQLRSDGRTVFGVAPSAAAADVLAAETGIEADTVDKLLTEHSLQRPPDHRYNLPVGSTVIVDEAGMLATGQLDRLATLADARGWRIALVGDPLQFSAVGRGGMFGHLIDTHTAIQLDQVHRFRHTWERDASLRLRQADPAVADLYDLHGRLHAGTATRMTAEALDAWWSARQQGQTVLLSAATNETVQTLNHAAQQIRVQAGDLDPRGRTAQTDLYTLHRGDQIVTRHNEQRLLSDQGLRVRNRDQWTIQRIHRSGDITATGDKGTIRLPSRYVNSHVELAYAQTAHATQGRTVDRSILLIDGPTDVRSLYVPLTRGRESNDAYIVTNGNQTAVEVFADAIGRSWIDQPTLARQAELHGHSPHRPGTLPADQLRDLYNTAAQLQATLHQHADQRHWLPRDLAVAERNLAEATVRREHLADSLTHARQTLAQHDRPFHRRGNEEEIAIARNRISLLPQQIDDTDRQISQHQATIHNTRAQLDQTRQFDQQRPELEQQLNDTWNRIHDDADIRAGQLRHQPTDTIVQHIGPRPIDDHLAQEWDLTAGQLDQHQTAYDTIGTPTTTTPATPSAATSPPTPSAISPGPYNERPNWRTRWNKASASNCEPVAILPWVERRPAGPVVRPAAKVILHSRHDCVLLFRGGDPARPDAGSWWFPPGGGLEAGETAEQAARREVLEETGLALGDLGPIRYHRTTEFMFDGQTIINEEDYFVVRVEQFDLDSGGWTELEHAIIQEHRWWRIEDLQATNETVYPGNVLDLLRDNHPPDGTPLEGRFDR